MDVEMNCTEQLVLIPVKHNMNVIYLFIFYLLKLTLLGITQMYFSLNKQQENLEYATQKRISKNT